MVDLGSVAAVTTASEDDEIAVLSAMGMVVRIPVASVSVISPSAAGVKVMGLEEVDEVVGLTAMPPSPNSDEDQLETVAEPIETEKTE